MRALFAWPLSFLRLIFQSVFLAMSQIWANKVRSILTTLGIIIAVGAVTSVIATLSGLKTKILTEMETFGMNKIMIGPMWPESGPNKSASFRIIRFQPEHFEGLLDHCPSVENFTRTANTNQMIQCGDRSIESARVHGIDAAWHDIESRPTILGRPFSTVDESRSRFVCLVDPQLRDKLHLDRDCIGDIITIGNNTYRIVGVIEEKPSGIFGGMGRGENYEVYIPFTTFWRLYEPWFGVAAASKSPEFSEDAKAEIKFFLRKTRRIKPGDPDTFYVMTIASQVNSFMTIATVFTAVAAGVVGVSLIVGGVGIMNIMLVSVSERTREIGLRKAVGARFFAILTQFLIEAIVLCCVGGLMGIGVGWLITLGIAQMADLLDQTSIPVWAMVVSITFSAFVGIFFGIFPAIKAAMLDPIEALRHE